MGGPVLSLAAGQPLTVPLAFSKGLVDSLNDSAFVVHHVNVIRSVIGNVYPVLSPRPL